METNRPHVSHSMLSSWLNCNRKYELSYLDRLELIQRPKALSMGSAFQKAIELGDPEAGARLLAEDRVVSSTEGEQDLQVDQAAVLAAAGLYLEHWPAPAGEQREVEYRVPILDAEGLDSGIDLLGYADGVIEHEDHIELIENKFVGRIDQVMLRRLPLDRQINLACWGLNEQTGKPVRVVHYRIIKKPTIRVKKDETISQFTHRLAADYRSRPDFYLASESLFRTAEDLELIGRELHEWAIDIYTDRDLHTRNTTHCHDYGGCPFLAICSGDPDAKTLYQERPIREEVPNVA